MTHKGGGTTMSNRYDAAVSGPTKEGDVSLERRGIEPVPEGARYGRKYRSFTVFFAPNIVPAAFFLGTLATASFIGLGWWTGLLAILLGNVIGSLLAGVLASMGAQTGLAQMPVSRASFGKSIAVPGVVNWATSIGWDAINNVFGAAALTLLTGLPFWASLIIIFAGQGVLAIFGYEAIHSFEKWATVVLGAMFLIVTVKVIGVGDFHRAAAVHGGDLVGSFILMTTITASFIIGFSVYASDYTRYLPSSTSRAAVFWRVALGMARAGRLPRRVRRLHPLHEHLHLRGLGSGQRPARRRRRLPGRLRGGGGRLPGAGPGRPAAGGDRTARGAAAHPSLRCATSPSSCAAGP